MISLENVTKVYENGARGITEASLSVNQGEFVFIVGTSGSGKSTLVRLLLKEIAPTSGIVKVNGMHLSQLRRKDMPGYRRKMGVVFQDFKLLKDKTVYENVAFAMQIVRASGRDIRRTVPQVLAMVGLEQKARAYPHQLSGGEKQRTAMARAIVNRPPLLLADEPTGNLDPETAWEIMDILEDINAEGTTVVVVTHAKDIVDGMRKRVISLSNGAITHDVANSSYGEVMDIKPHF